jgi:protease IV
MGQQIPYHISQETLLRSSLSCRSSTNCEPLFFYPPPPAYHLRLFMNIIKNFFVFIGLLLRWIWRFVTTGIMLFTNLLYLSLFVLVFAAIYHREPVQVPSDSALVLDLAGTVVEQATLTGPIRELVARLNDSPLDQEVVLHELIDCIESAASDDRIKALVLDTRNLQRIDLDQVEAVGIALEHFKAANKKLIARADQYGQAPYLLASYADEIYLHPMGGIDLRGFAVYQLYMEEMLAKLDVEFNVFRAGQYKAALEPFMRNDMSPEAEEANRLWLTNFWQVYSDQIISHRGLRAEALNEATNNLDRQLVRTGGDRAQLALELGLVDGLKNHQEFNAYLAELVGANGDDDFRQISYQHYLQAIKTPARNLPGHSNRIGIIVAQGNIVYGQGSTTSIGADSLCAQLQAARRDDTIKALVLRLDTGGGSAFASELIRQELLQFKNAGKPVVVSMGTLTASGGYWIASAADRIIASPLTLTGSIGVFGAMPTFEKTLARLGIHGDGVGTTRFADLGNPTRTMSAAEQQMFQIQVDQIYRQFIDLVAKGRELDPQRVEEIAGGRVWDGAAAKEIGLVDQLGTLETAIDVAAELAGVPKENSTYLDRAASPLDSFLQQMEARIAARDPKLALLQSAEANTLSQLLDQFGFLFAAQDPHHIYAHALLPEPIGL